MDAYSEFYQITMIELDQEKTLFITSKGTYWYIIMSFELKNAEVTYQRLVNSMFAPLIGKKMKFYIDNMLVKSTKATWHEVDLDEACKILCKYNMKLNSTKCSFGVTKGTFLGIIVH